MNSLKKFTLIKEIWKPIIDFEELYKISNNANIIKIDTNKSVKPYICNDTYYVNLYKNNKRYKRSLAKLVAEHFVLNPNNYTHIYFVDGNNKNCCANNIQWNITTRDTKIVVDGIIFESLKAYKEFCKINEHTNYLLELEDICEFNIENKKNKFINAQFKV